MSANISGTLKADFDAAFVFPHTTRRWKSERGRDYWIDLQIWKDALAGPVYNIVKYGNCAYVYSRDDVYFHDVENPDQLRVRLREWYCRLTAVLDEFVPDDQAEQEDLAVLRQITTRIWAVVESAVEIERLRFLS
ncbi:hypothetical protein [Asticcacaulis solisilvae]|uniref:hypothetical protein n=1 Tax=Asticcacaulis solisilvae TaxID=1217274 RepID=UPI003FD6F2AE